MIMAALAVSSLPAIAQTPPGNEGQKPGQTEERRDDPAGRRARRDRRGGEAERARWDRYRNASPEERQKMRSERMLEMTARNYELTDEQKERVRAEMDKMREERRAQMGPDADRYDQLRDKMIQYWDAQRESGGRNAEGSPGRDDAFQKLREEMREIERKYPFDWQASINRIESLLPPEQAAKGRARFEERRQRWQDRRQNREMEFQDDLFDAVRQSEQAIAEGQAEKAMRLLNRAERRLNRRGLSDDVREQLRARIQLAKQQIQPELPQDGAEAAPVAEHPWEKYVSEFAARHALTATQQASASAILRDVRSRASQIEVANAGKIAATAELSDAKLREAKLKELNAPIEKLFEELKIRLDGLLTAEQRAKAPKTNP